MSSDKPLTGKRILVVDDEELVREVTVRRFAKDGATTHAFASAAQALAAMHDLKFDLIITDLAMPKMTGLELIAELEKRDILWKIPAIILSGSLSREQKLRALNYGVLPMDKPVDLDVLAATVKFLLRSMGGGCQCLNGNGGC